MCDLSIKCENKRVAAIYIYNLLFNFIINLIKNTDGEHFSVTVVGTRFTRESGNYSRIITTVIDGTGRDFRKEASFVMIKSRGLKMRDILSYIPFSKNVVNRLMASVNFRSLKCEFVRYDAESGTMIVNIPNNPNFQNTGFVTRNMNTRMSENAALHVDNINTYMLLLFFSKFYRIILSDHLLTNFF